MDRIRSVDYLGKEILVLDYGGLEPDGYRALMKQVVLALSVRPPKSALTITIVKGTRFKVGTSDEIKAYSRKIQPHVKASAVVGLSALQEIIFLALKPFLTSGIETFASLELAKQWLASRP